MSDKKKYELIPLSEITDEARRIAVVWCENYHRSGFDIQQKHKLASDIMNYADQELASLREQLKHAEDWITQDGEIMEGLKKQLKQKEDENRELVDALKECLEDSILRCKSLGLDPTKYSTTIKATELISRLSAKLGK